MDENFRLSDNDRLHALQSLGSHYADGRLDSQEFDERTGLAAQARTVADLRPAFEGLPGGLPLQVGEQGVLVPVTLNQPAVPRISDELAEMEELKDLKRRGKKMEALNGVIFGVTLVAFLILQFVIGVGWAWVVWPSLALTMTIPRLMLRYSDDDEKTYEELKKVETEARKERIHRAAQRMRELEEDR
ncbi:hypothetical protein COCCU_03885 [Corynebacterium occultum]|uniref:DUF1707 domain-containing protein n=1 Tax=Corynebacterium occultum TaxID=2675219 RepID=A0A6B8W5Y3_9CORY|nr:DUF1707 domain-containing protein [Corynebacterium occultum]QGU06725.1 hypothetical protein COCCU_03885 [Corynebacterium occultum]